MIHQHLTYVPPTVIRRVLCKLADVWKWFRRHEPFLNQKSPWNSQRFLKFHWHFVGESILGASNPRWWCFNSNWDILFNPHPNLRGVPWVFLPVLSVMITIVGELIKKMLPTVCWYDMRAILLQYLGGSALWEVIFVWEPCHQEWKICEMAFHIEGLICIICSATMFKLYLPAGRFGLGGSKISYLILVSLVRLGQFLSSALALTVTQKIRIRTGTVRSSFYICLIVMAVCNRKLCRQ